MISRLNVFFADFIPSSGGNGVLLAPARNTIPARATTLEPGDSDREIPGRSANRGVMVGQATIVAAIEFTVCIRSVLREASQLPMFLRRFSR